MAILSNELVRRLSNIHQEVLEEEIKEVIERYVGQWKNSGYDRKQAKEIKVWLARREKSGQDQYLEAKETLEKRTNDKLLENTSWYKENSKRKIEKQVSRYQYNPP